MLDALDRVGMRRQSQRADEVGRELTLVGEIVHGQHGRRTAPVAIGEIGHRQPGLPVVAVEDIRREARGVTAPEARRDPSQRTEAKRVVRPVAAVAPDIRIAGPVEEMRRVEDKEVKAAGVGGEHARRPAEELVDCEDFFGLPERAFTAG
jgi:hypothetical protein